MIFSYTSLADYRTCPRYFKAKHVDKLFKFVETPAMARGDRLHKDMEKAIEQGSPLPSEFKGDKGLVELLRKYEARAEVKIGVTDDWRGCQFFHDLVKVRGKLDVYLPITRRHAAICVDWKSGNPNYTDAFQAKVYGAMLSAATSIEKVLFIWGYFSGEMPYKSVDGSAARLEVDKVVREAERDEEYQPRPCWKCRFCDLTSCEYNENKEVFDG